MNRQQRVSEDRTCALGCLVIPAIATRRDTYNACPTVGSCSAHKNMVSISPGRGKTYTRVEHKSSGQNLCILVDLLSLRPHAHKVCLVYLWGVIYAINREFRPIVS